MEILICIILAHLSELQLCDYHNCSTVNRNAGVSGVQSPTTSKNQCSAGCMDLKTMTLYLTPGAATPGLDSQISHALQSRLN